ncbi:MAG: glutamate 5-kinase, partial [Candidatus Omnitrophota bacterium]
MQSQKKYKRIVIKIGSSLFCGKNKIDPLRSFEAISQISALVSLEKKEIVIVSSGAIALGMNLLKLDFRPKELPLLQAAAAIGQNALMDSYSKNFAKYKIRCAQVLLTWDDFDDRQRYLNAKNTLSTLMKLGVVPVINENDTISTEEIKFGDNDRLSAQVASLINADLLIILSDVDGLLDKDKNVVSEVIEITPQIRSLACSTNKKTCVGGMVTKIEAAKIAVDSGIPCVIARGSKSKIIHSIINDPRNSGTLFLPKKGLKEKERWIAFGSKAKGKILVDDGAKKALIDKRSLLAVGVVSCEGNFSTGDIVCICDNKNIEFARGKSAISAKELDRAKGSRFSREIIHRDNIVILGDAPQG